jgi:hypothetical protein
MPIESGPEHRQLLDVDCNNLIGTFINLPEGTSKTDFVVRALAPPPGLLLGELQTWLIGGMERPELGPGDQFFTPLEQFVTELCQTELEQFLAAFTTINRELAQLGGICSGDIPE